MTDPTDDDVRTAEAVLHGIVREALDCEFDNSPDGLDVHRATDSVLAALEDELPDGYDALLEQAHDQAAARLGQEET